MNENEEQVKTGASSHFLQALQVRNCCFLYEQAGMKIDFVMIPLQPTERIGDKNRVNAISGGSVETKGIFAESMLTRYLLANHCATRLAKMSGWK
jgi:hypothetical protein